MKQIITRIFLPLVLVLVFLIYLQAADGPYISDDMSNLLNNDTLILSDFSFESLKEAALSSTASQFYRPISMLTFALNYTLAGDKSPLPINLTNIILHLIIGTGIFFLSRKILPRLMPSPQSEDNRIIDIISLTASGLWLSHPLFVSTVLYSVQRMAMLSAFFVIFGCISYVHFREKIISQDKGYYALLTILPLFTILGFFAKENAFLLPGFVLLIEYYCYGFELPQSAPRRFKIILGSFLMVPVVFVFIYLAYAYITQFGTPLVNHSFNINERVLTEPRILLHYLGWLTFLNPEPLGFYHDDIQMSRSITEPVSTLVAIITWVVLLTASLKAGRFSSICSFSLLWFLWGHSLESTVLPLFPIYEHRNYLPGYGPLLALAVLIGLFLIRSRKNRIFSILLLSALILPPLLLHERVRIWADQGEMIRWHVINHPVSVKWLTNAANQLAGSRDLEHALEALNRAHELDPDNSAVLFNRIRILCNLQPDQEFNDRLRQRMKITPIETISADSRMYYSDLTDICTRSEINHEYLMELYDRFARTPDTTIRVLSYLGKGRIYLSKGDYRSAMRSWSNASEIQTSPRNSYLIPMISEFKAQITRNISTETDEAVFIR